MEGVFDYRLFRSGTPPSRSPASSRRSSCSSRPTSSRRLARRLVSDRLLARTHLSIGVRYMLGRFTGYTVFVLGSIMALQTVGIRATTLTAFGAALGVGIGFGLQDIVKNFVAGLIILIERPFQVGDRIEIDKVNAEVVGDPVARDGPPHQRRRPPDRSQLEIHPGDGRQPQLRPAALPLPRSGDGRQRLGSAHGGRRAPRGRPAHGGRARGAAAIGSVPQLRALRPRLRAALLDGTRWFTGRAPWSAS